MKNGEGSVNRSSSGLSLSKALVGFLNSKAAEGLSDRTLINYEFRLKQWIDFAGVPGVESVTPQAIRKYLVWLRTENRPRRYNGDRGPLSPKTIRNHPLFFLHLGSAGVRSPEPDAAGAGAQVPAIAC